jgi:hypothetical protein
VQFPYDQTSTIDKIIASHSLEKFSHEYTADCKIWIKAPIAGIDDILSSFNAQKNVIAQKTET